MTKKSVAVLKQLKKIKNGQLKTSILMIWAHFGPAAEKKKHSFPLQIPKNTKNGSPRGPKKVAGPPKRPRRFALRREILNLGCHRGWRQPKKQKSNLLDTKKHLFGKNGKVDFEKFVSFCQNPLHPDPSCIEGVGDFDTFGARK